MAVERPGVNKHHVDSQVIARPVIVRSQCPGGGCDAGQAALVNGKVQIGGARAGLDLDKGDHLSPPGDQIDFAHSRSNPAGQNSPAPNTQPECAKRLRPSPARFGLLTAHTSLRSEEHTSELQSLMRISYAVFCLKKKKKIRQT